MDPTAIRERIAQLAVPSRRGYDYDLLPGNSIFDVFEAVSGIPKNRFAQIDKLRSHCSDYYTYADRANLGSGVEFYLHMLNDDPADFEMAVLIGETTLHLGTFEGGLDDD